MEREEINSKDARKKFSDNINRVAYGGERLTITRHGKGVAAIIPIEDLEFLEELEDELDRRAIEDALEEQAAEPLEDWNDVKREINR